MDNALFQNKTKEEVIKEISELRKNIKKKHRSLKHDIMESEEMWKKQLDPIAAPLMKLVEEGEKKEAKKRKLETGTFETPPKRYIPNPPQGVKRKQKLNLPFDADYESDYGYGEEDPELPARKRLSLPPNNDMEIEERQQDPEEEMEIATTVAQQPPEVYESPVTGEELINTPEGRDIAKQFIDNTFKGKLAKEYFIKLIKGGRLIDHTYGVRVIENSWMLGDKQIDIDNNDILINGKRYNGTRGLYELIFMNSPNEYIYDEIDLDNYGLILRETNAHRKNNTALGKVKSNRGYKYKNIISRLIVRDYTKEPLMMTYNDYLNPSTSGSGMQLTEAKPQLVYWNDPNELVDRLKTLNASQQAGNTGHTNEINSIIEELLELERNNEITIHDNVNANV